MNSCRECKWWVKTGCIDGQCRKRPPVLHPTDDHFHKDMAYWPHTDASNCCGEFEYNKEAEYTQTIADLIGEKWELEAQLDFVCRTTGGTREGLERAWREDQK